MCTAVAGPHPFVAQEVRTHARACGGQPRVLQGGRPRDDDDDGGGGGGDRFMNVTTDQINSTMPPSQIA